MPPCPWEEVTADADQRAVVDLPVASSGVVAGAPGTGKTATIVARVVQLVRSGLAPEDVLVLTPTRQAATSLRDTLALATGVASAGPLARSVAAFAFQLVRAAAVHEGQEPPQLLTGPDEDRLIQDLLAGDAEDELTGPSRWPARLSAEIRSTAGFRGEVRAFLAEATTLGLEPDRLAALARQHDREVWAAMASFAREYHRVRADLRGAHRDAAGLVREALGLLRTLPPHAPALGPLAGLRTILVDDAQELTLGGVELLEACRARGIAVLAFGDPDVGSGSFRGARPENFARLAAVDAVHVLRTAHRGTAFQRDLLAEVTSRIGAAGLVSHRHAPRGAVPDGSVRTFALRSASEEYDTIARLLRERHVHDGIPWAQCAVIAHDTRQVTALEAELAAREVPTAASGPGQALSATRAVRDLLRLVELASREHGEWHPDDVAHALEGGGLDPVELRRLRTALRHAALQDAVRPERPPHEAETSAGIAAVPGARELLASAMAFPAEFAAIDTREGRRAARIAETVALVRAQLATDATAHELLWTVWERSGRERAWRTAAEGHGTLAEQARRDLDAVVALFEAAKRHGEREDGTGALDFIRGMLHSQIAEDRLMAPIAPHAVRVLTPAGALGTEFDTVVVAGVQEGVWPNLRTRGGLLDTWRLADGDTQPDAVDRRRTVLHDELRLFVRALSRARTLVVVTAVDDDETGPSVLFELLPPAAPAPRAVEHPLSLRGLVAQHRRTLTEPRSAQPARAHAAGQLALLAAAGVAGADPAHWYGVAAPTAVGPLHDLAAAPVRVSPSRLHALEECELNWAISDLGADAGTTVAGIGTILHDALERAAGADERTLWRMVEERWGELEFEAEWIGRAEHARARDLVSRLAAYLRDFDAIGGALVSAEPHFEIDIPIAGAGDGAHPAVLSGYIDRVEQLADGSIVIVDLKTGRSEPTTAGAVASNPQLAAYQLAFERGAIAGTEGGVAGGAKLLVLRQTRTAPYAAPVQAPFDDETRAAFLDRVQAAVGVMRGRRFIAPFEEHCRDDHTRGLCRIHTIGAVSSA